MHVYSQQKQSESKATKGKNQLEHSISINIYGFVQNIGN